MAQLRSRPSGRQVLRMSALIGGLVAFLASLPASAQTTLFSDTFNRTTGLGPSWSVLYGSYSTDGTHAVSGTPPENGNWVSPTTSLGTDDYAVQADIIIPTGSVDTGLFARSYDSTNYDMSLYALELNADGTLNLYRRNDWNWTLLSSVNAGITAGTTYTAKLVVTGSNPVHLEGWLGSSKLISYDDDSTGRLSVGRCGLVNYVAGAKYTNFSVSTVPAHLFADYFESSGTLDSNWTVDYGSYTTDGANALSGVPPSNGNWAHVVPGLATNDYAVSADLSIPAGSFNSGVVARSSVAGYFDDDLYSALIHSDGTVALYRRNNWTWTQLGSVSAGIVPNTFYNVKLVVSSSNPVHLEVWLNGTKKISYDDNSTSQITSGIPGIQSYKSGVKFADFFVDSSSGGGGSSVMVSVSTLGSGGGTITSSPSGISCPGTCSMWVTPGTSVTFYQAPNSTSNFAGWGGACQAFDSCTVTANNNQSVFGTFNPKNAEILVSLIGSGVVTPSWGSVRCDPSGGTCSETVPYNTPVTLTANPSTGYMFVGWDGACSGTSTTCTLSATSNESVTATFSNTPPPPTVTLTVAISGSGTVTSNPSGIDCPGTCSMSVARGTTVTFTASPAANYTFRRWDAWDGCGPPTPCTLQAPSTDATLTAYFLQNQIVQSQLYPCGDHKCAHGEFPPAGWVPYGPDSPFNIPFPVDSLGNPNPTLWVPNQAAGNYDSDTMVSYQRTYLATRPGPENILLDPNGNNGWPTYYSTANDYSDQVNCIEYGAFCAASAYHFYAPGGAKRQGDLNARSGDMHLTVIDQENNQEIDMFHAPDVIPVTNANTENGNPIVTGSAGYLSDVMGGTGQASGAGEGNAGHVGSLAGRIRLEEFSDAILHQSYLHHALAITVTCTNGHSVPPAGTNPGLPCADVKGANFTTPDEALPMGARLWLDLPLSTINDPNLHIPEWKRVILRTLNKYGAIVMDTSQSRVLLQFQTESDRQYTVFNSNNPAWSNWAASQPSGSDWSYSATNLSNGVEAGWTGSWQDTDDGLSGGWSSFIWSHLKVVAPCVSMNNCHN
jgi:uncharacterized repeat protein (TIGR02543 family)